MNARQAPFGIGVIGLGFMGRTHMKAWQAASDDGSAICSQVQSPDRAAARRQHVER